jgi:hypothetical protein
MALALVVVVLGAATAYAAVVGPNGVIHGCYSNQAQRGTHTLVLLDVGARCPANTTAIQWNQQGPQGPAGAANGTAVTATSPVSPTIVAPGQPVVWTTVATATLTLPAQHTTLVTGFLKAATDTCGSCTVAARFTVDGGAVIDPNDGTNGGALVATGAAPPLSAQWSASLSPGAHSVTLDVSVVNAGGGSPTVSVGYRSLAVQDLGH